MKIGSYELQVPFVTTSSDNAKIVLSLAGISEGQKVIDLGSGDGRMVLEFAKAGAIVDGYEIKEELVKKSQERITNANQQDKAHVYNTSFWNINLSKYDVIYIYGMQSIMNRLQEKLENELQPDAIFISNIFRLPSWKPKKIKGNVYLYKVSP